MEQEEKEVEGGAEVEGSICHPLVYARLALRSIRSPLGSLCPSLREVDDVRQPLQWERPAASVKPMASMWRAGGVTANIVVPQGSNPKRPLVPDGQGAPVATEALI